LDNDRANYFNKYLFLGGIDTGPRMFQSQLKYDTTGYTKSEMRQVEAVDLIHLGATNDHSRFWSPGSERWDVDFAGVAAGFLSEALPRLTGYQYHAMAKGVSLVENFLKYVLQHDVCPEYADNIKEALKICDLAKEELPLSYECRLQFPGQFNLAAIELYCEADPFIGPQTGFQRPNDFNARKVLSGTIALIGSMAQREHLSKLETAHVADETDCHMEVVSIHRPSADIAKLFQGIKIPPNKQAKLPPMGKAVLKPCKIDDGWDYTDLWNAPTFIEKEETFLLDDNILVRMRPGYKLFMTVCKLSTGLKFIKEVRFLRPSFYTFLPQEMMAHYKPPADNERLPPTVNDPDIEERELGKDLKDL
jgi:hypothetical protein